MTSLNQAYQLFIDEVPELLQEIETGLLHIQSDKSTAKIHRIMRAAHSIKGGAASVGLQTIKSIAHQLEEYLKALYDENLIVDTQLENLFLEAYDCLAIPLTQQLQTGDFERQEAQAKIDSLKTKLEPKITQALQQVENYLPSSEDLGIDLIHSLFEVDIAQEIRRLKGVVASPETFDPEKELAESLAILKGLSEVANLPGFSILLGITEQAIENHPDKPIIIISLLLHDLEISRNLVLNGDRTEGGNPCSNLLKLAEDLDADLDKSAVNRIIKDQKTTLTLNDPVYQFFLAEIPDLLHTLESALLSIKDDKSINNINDIMRAAHSIKGGAASVGLDGIKNIAHKLEDYIKALFNETVIVDDELETDFLNAFDCLKNALLEQIEQGNYSLHWQEEAEIIWQKLDERLGSLVKTDYLPSSEDLGIDIVRSLFEVDLANAIEQLQISQKDSSGYELVSAINQQLDIICGLAEVAAIPQLKQIATISSQALTLYPEKVPTIASLLIDDVSLLQQQVLNEGKDTQLTGLPSLELLQLAEVPEQEGQDEDWLMNLVEAVEEDNSHSSQENLNTTLDFTQLVSELQTLEAEHKLTLSDISGLEEPRSNSDDRSSLFTANSNGQTNDKNDIFGELIELPESSLFSNEFLEQISQEKEEEEEKLQLEDIFEPISTENIFEEISISDDIFSEAEADSSNTQQQELQAQSYKFFIEEAIDLIAQIDENLEEVLTNRHLALINEVARCAHSLKGGARSAGLENLGTIALRTEKSLKALFNEEIPLGNPLKSYLREMYQLLREAVVARIENREFDEATAAETADRMWAEFEAQFGEEIAKAQEFLPSSSDLGIDIATSIFEVDVLEGINNLQSILDTADETQITETITTQIEVFTGFGEMLSLPGFTSISTTTLEALSQNPEQLLSIAQEFVKSLQLAREQVLEGNDRTVGGEPSEQLSLLAGKITTVEGNSSTSIDSAVEIEPTKDPAYNFFMEEAPELLQVIESGLLNLKEEQRDTAKIHELMRAAHSLKGGASNFDLEEIKTISHRLEDVFKVLYNPQIEVDTELETWLLESFDCLETALNAQIQTGSYDEEKVTNRADRIWENIKLKLGTPLTRTDDYIPSSTDLGVDIVDSMFEVDVAEELERLKNVITQPVTEPLKGELRATLEVFSGFGKILNLPGFERIGVLGLQAIDTNPDCLIAIAKILIRDVEKARDLVLKGDRLTGGEASPELIHLAQEQVALDENMQPSIEGVFGEQLSELDRIFQLTPISKDTQISSSSDEELSIVSEQDLQIDNLPSVDEDEVTQESSESIVELEDIFASELSTSEINLLSAASELALEQDKNQTIPSVNEIFQLPEIEDISWDEENDNPADSYDNISLSSVFGSQENESAVFDASNNHDRENQLSPALEDVFGTLDYEELQDADEEVQTEVVVDNNSSSQNQQSEVTTEDNIELKNSNIDTEERIDENYLQENVPTSLAEAIESIGDIYQKLPGIKTDASLKPSAEILKKAKSKLVTTSERKQTNQKVNTTPANHKSNLSIRVDLERLERMNNLIGELSINRNGLSLQNDKLQTSVQELSERFGNFQQMANNLRDLADKMLVSPEKFTPTTKEKPSTFALSLAEDEQFSLNSAFDALEMDRYDNLYSVVQSLLEQMIQLEEAVDDIALFASQSGETVEGQRQMLNRLRDELMWARMLPLSEILNRFPRVLRDLSVKYNKKVNLKMEGTSVLVDKAALEKLYDPLVHLIRNGFDHGIETPEIRRQRGKSVMGTIKVKAYHQGNQTIIEIIDDGNGLNLEKIKQKAIDSQLITLEQSQSMNPDDLLNLIFEPGFSTAAAVTEISGRGVGLDIVRSQLRALKGNISVNSEYGIGTTFVLSLPLTLTIDKLLVLSMGQHFYALPSDNITEIIVPEAKQIKTSGNQRFLYFENNIVPIYSLNNLLDYRCYRSELTTASNSLDILPTPEEWGNPLLVLSLGKELFALEVEHLVSEQELVIKPFGKSLSAPIYTYGCTILSDGTLIPVINTATLLSNFLQVTQGVREVNIPSVDLPQNNDSINDRTSKTFQVATVLVVDDSAAMRRTLALSLEKAGYRVIQAKDGKEALDQLQQLNNVSLVICDIEMPNMNGFEFLGQRRRYPELNKVPVAMLTSRSNDKHRKLATHLGANAYFTKPYIEQKFLQSIDRLVNQKSLATI